MQILLIMLLLSCSSPFKQENNKNEEIAQSRRISFQQMSLKFEQQQQRLSKKNEELLNELAQKIQGTSQQIEKITIFSNPHHLDLTPKELLLNYDRANNTRRFLQKDLHSSEKIKISEEEKVTLIDPQKDSDIIILIEYL